MGEVYKILIKRLILFKCLITLIFCYLSLQSAHLGSEESHEPLPSLQDEQVVFSLQQDLPYQCAHDVKKDKLIKIIASFFIFSP